MMARENDLQIRDVAALDGALRHDDDVDVVDLVERRGQHPVDEIEVELLGRQTNSK
jgi:hypothetical protein